MLRALGLAVVALALLAGIAPAQTAADLAGTWKRLPTKDSPDPTFFRFTAGEGGLQGTLLNPPEKVECKVTLEVKGPKVTGAATWSFDGEVEKTATSWEFTLDANGQKLSGRNEVLLYDDNDELKGKEWEPRTLERVARLGLVTTGEAEEAFGEPIADLPGIAGGWRGPGGGWAITVEGGQVGLVPVGHSDGVRIGLKDERGSLKGRASMPGGSSDIELAMDEGKLVGRASWREDPSLGELAQTGWGPLSFERLPRLDPGSEAAPERPAAGEAGPLDGVWKRDDGKYLRVKVEGGQTVGVLSGKDGKPVCRVRLEEKSGVWEGAANWDGVEARWELVKGADGSLSGRCEWVDALDGRVVARGFAARKFAPLRRIH